MYTSSEAGAKFGEHYSERAAHVASVLTVNVEHLVFSIFAVGTTIHSFCGDSGEGGVSERASYGPAESLDPRENSRRSLRSIQGGMRDEDPEIGGASKDGSTHYVSEVLCTRSLQHMLESLHVGMS